MSENYLLDCRCGEQLTVSPRQAGGQARCGCGATVEVPTLRAMRRLPVAEAPTAVEHASWSLRQRLWVVGGLLVAAAAILGGSTRLNRPPPPDEAIKAELIESAEQFRRAVPRYSVAQVRESFIKLASFDLRMAPNIVDQHPYHDLYKQRVAQNETWSLVAWALAGLGIVAIASSHVLAAAPRNAGRSKKPRRERPPSRRAG